MSSPVPATPTDPVHPRGDRARVLIAMAVVTIAPSLYSFHFMSFAHAKLAGLGAGVAILALIVRPEAVWDRARLKLFAPLFALLVWAGGSALFSGSNFWLSAGLATGAGYLVMLLAALVLLAAAPGVLLQRALVFSCVPVAVLALGQYSGFLPGLFPVFPDYDQRIYSVFGNQDLLGGYLAVGLALSLALWRTGTLPVWAAVAVLLSALPGLLLSGSRSAWLAAAFGMVAAMFAAGPARARRQHWMPAAMAALAIVLAMSLVAPHATWQRVTGTFAQGDVGYRIRLWIWDGTAHLVGQHPVFGVGLGNYAYRSPVALGEVLHARGPGVHMFNHVHTQHAHSDLLEIAAEAGVVGVLLIAVFLVLMPRRRDAAWAGLIAAFVFSLINTTLHSPPHVLAVLILAGSLPQSSERSAPRAMGAVERRVQGAVLAVTVIALVYVALEPSWKYARAQLLYEAGKQDAAAQAYRAAMYLPGNHAAALEYAVMLANARRVEDAISAMHYAAQGVDTGDLHYLRAFVAERNLPMRAAADAFRECLRRWPDHRPSHEGLIRNSGPAEREALLAEAKRWLPPADYAAVTNQPSAPR